MREQRHLRLTREELYQLVWAKPMTQIAKDYKVSDRAMAKLCSRKQVPVPSRGYWAKIHAKQKMVKPPLLTFVEKTKEEKTPAENQWVNDENGRETRNTFEDREKQVKIKLKEFHKRVSGGLQYNVRIESWNADYFFGLNSRYNPLREYDQISALYESPYDEYCALRIKGKIFDSPQLNGQKIEVTISPNENLNKTNTNKNLYSYRSAPPQSIGSFQKAGHYIMALIFVPNDAFSLLMQNASAEKINFMSFHGEKMRYGHGDIFRFSLQEAL